MQPTHGACIIRTHLFIRIKGYKPDVQLPVHLRIGLRRPSGQDRRPDLRRSAGRHPGAGQARPRGLRDDGQDRRCDRGRRSDHQCLDRSGSADPQGHSGHRLQQFRRRLRRRDLWRAQPDRQAVAGHQPGRGSQEPRAAGCGRPGPDVRLCHQRNRQLHAGGDPPLAPPGRAAGQDPQEEELGAVLAASGRQVAGHPAL